MKKVIFIFFFLVVIIGLFFGIFFNKKISNENYSKCIDQWSDMIDICLPLESKVCWEEIDKKWIACKLIEKGISTSTPEEINIIYRFINLK